MTAAFAFDTKLSPEENIDLFLKDLEAKEPQLTAALRSAMREMLPLPGSGPERNKRRIAANTKVIEALEPSDAQQKVTKL